uniref:Uncharacterized protein n=1 Tax=Arundo donax TaxID=35708 RepID=A0A0A9T7U1_ARUDO
MQRSISKHTKLAKGEEQMSASPQNKFQVGP